MKVYYCDNCGKITWALYTLNLLTGKTIEVCRDCFYKTYIKELDLLINTCYEA